jgi:Family of unknown function (DUF5994)
MEPENRLQLKPYRSASEHIDGAWWPRSQHLADELPDLVASVSDRLGQVVMVGYRRNGWDETPPLAEIAGHTIELLGFTSAEPASVILIGEDGRHTARNPAGHQRSGRSTSAGGGSGGSDTRRRRRCTGQPLNDCAIRGRRRRQAGPSRGDWRRAANRSDQAVV